SRGSQVGGAARRRRRFWASGSVGSPGISGSAEGDAMSAEDLERFETDLELALYREYRDVLPMFHYVVETARRFYLCNGYHLEQHENGGDTWVELTLSDARVWDGYRPTRFVTRGAVRQLRAIAPD